MSDRAISEAATAAVSGERPTTAIVPAYGMREVGGFGIRGWRVHCDCSHLSGVYRGYSNANQAAVDHRNKHKGAA